VEIAEIWVSDTVSSVRCERNRRFSRTTDSRSWLANSETTA
jgi:hypothetical protein